MKILGLNLSRAKQQPPQIVQQDGGKIAISFQGKLYPVDNRGGWYPYLPYVQEWYAGAWQNNDTDWSVDSVLAFHAVYACISLIASDIGKLKIGLVKRDKNDIWSRYKRAPIDTVLRKPNPYQNHIQFKFWWIASKLIWGNTYVLKVYDNRGKINGLYILDASKVKPLISESGNVYYQLNQDNLNGLSKEQIVVPASEIIHDRMNCLFHPLVGVSPLYASGLAASHGLKIEEDSKSFFANGANPGGLLLAPGSISDDTANRLKEYWQSNFTGSSRGKIAALGDGLSFQQLRMTSHDAQMIEQLKWNAEIVCSAFHVPTYKVGVGQMPTHDNIEALTLDYYTNCLQIHIEDMEAGFDDCFQFTSDIETRVDIDGLVRMDSEKKLKTLGEGVSKSVMAPNEARQRMNLPPVPGGDSVYLQQQNFSLEALSQRDANDPFQKPETPPPTQPTEPEEPDDDDEPDEEEDVTELALLALNSKKLGTT